MGEDCLDSDKVLPKRGRIDPRGPLNLRADLLEPVAVGDVECRKWRTFSVVSCASCSAIRAQRLWKRASAPEDLKATGWTSRVTGWS